MDSHLYKIGVYLGQPWNQNLLELCSSEEEPHLSDYTLSSGYSLGMKELEQFDYIISVISHRLIN